MWTDQEIQARVQATVEWLQERVFAAKANGLVVGISGGVDSAVVAGLCKRAFPERSLGVIMPAQSNPEDKDDAQLIARTFGLRVIEVDLGTVHTQIMSQVENGIEEAGIEPLGLRICQGNLKARLRMASLYSVANALDYLVVGTDNAPESYTGYFTKYGDGGVDLLPISSLTKTEVRVWARALGLPEKIASRVPTAGLWPGQTDETEMGLTYDRIDRYLLGEKVPDDVRERIETLHQQSEHKRHLPPSLELPRLERLD
ncbi:MAG: NAD(+) synthase [Desulfitobacteriaceae bacterium]|nr:NAD(+) synthase [Desulfitobacteriaceae bacterium]MDI6878209.1 NAD(+) synthase [Desulfitobacteriaceae bacterium]MDI6913478.1 NAD(+) synthase [Desulfitobacteriaceae bacterium]